MTTIIAFIIIFGILVIVHEFGHYFFAKKSGILVREFSVGMGPKAFSMRRNGTAYTLRWLPLGGYVRMAGLGDDELELEPGTAVSLLLDDTGKVRTINTSDKVTTVNGIPMQIVKTDLERDLYVEGYENGDESQVKRYFVNHDATIIEEDGTEIQIAPLDVQFQSVSLPKRMMTNFAGPMNNFILAILAFILVGFMQGGPIKDNNEIGQIEANSPAARSGLVAGDRIVAVNGHKTKDFNAYSARISAQPNKKIKVTIDHKGQESVKTIKTTSQTSNKKKVGLIGVSPARDQSLGAKVSYGFTETWSLTTQIFTVLGSFFTGGFSLNKLAGPVGIYSMTNSFASQGLLGLTFFLGYLSLNLGIMNLIPIPALDGGKLLLNLIEAVRGKPVSEEHEGIITLIGVGFLVILMLLVTWNDIQQFFVR
ncbi:hypothetical protein IV38_GL000495 [Lactobacillus selangorensis]|uniref:Zinc metalloprotease n=1 Tax=Lactobacillus selangorensis TaxID=81857 RepID=A0A0R2FLW8_9LACO|nr:RIP metalloprotease RseP [Lactobacillus selangorensis]KRN29609.1 hypothetical protein IV38_GL000495 [Lactobacillus selangorensis]KRN33861.1 hypothetical protein IV40_GL000173 [Lactobacillus selangorensis]